MDHSSATFSKPLIAFTAAYLLTAVIAAAVQQNIEFVFYLVVMGVLVSVVFVVHSKVHLSAGLLWGLSLWGLLHMAGGLLPLPAAWTQEGSQAVLYSWWIIPERLKYDQVVHAFGFALCTWLSFQVLRKNVYRQTGQWPRATFGLCFLSGICGMGFGALNEVIEFIAVLTIPNTNVGGYENTGWDLVSNLVGSAIAAVWLRWAYSESEGPRP